MTTSSENKRPNWAIINLVLLIQHLVVQVEPASHPHRTVAEEFCYVDSDRSSSTPNTCAGPSSWPGVCTTGQNQSPINIQRSWANYEDWDVEDTEIFPNPAYLHKHRGFYAINNGHTIQIQLNSDKRNPNSDMTISGAGLDNSYTFAQLHFHWGQRDDFGSEHTLWGKRFPMELHLVHFKTEYKTLNDALTKDDPEAVAVFVIFFELGEENRALTPIVAAASFPSMNLHSVGDKLTHFRMNLRIHDLFPQKLNFFRYLGSLTTPPCTEKVVWTVFTHPVTISRAQLQVFRRLRDDEKQIYFNHRPVQPRNGRQISFFRTWGWGAKY